MGRAVIIGAVSLNVASTTTGDHHATLSGGACDSVEEQDDPPDLVVALSRAFFIFQQEVAT